MALDCFHLFTVKKCAKNAFRQLWQFICNKAQKPSQYGIFHGFNKIIFCQFLQIFNFEQVKKENTWVKLDIV